MLSPAEGVDFVQKRRDAEDITVSLRKIKKKNEDKKGTNIDVIKKQPRTALRSSRVLTVDVGVNGAGSL